MKKLNKFKVGDRVYFYVCEWDRFEKGRIESANEDEATYLIKYFCYERERESSLNEIHEDRIFKTKAEAIAEANQKCIDEIEDAIEKKRDNMWRIEVLAEEA